MYRSSKVTKSYKQHLKKGGETPDSCDFCVITRGNKQFIRETRSFKVLRNIFPYSFWDYHLVKDHLLIVPKKHINSLAKISNQSASEFVRLVSEYEEKGYSIYARSPESTVKSIQHQHTHLIKTGKRSVRGLIFFRKPQIRWLIK